MFYIYQKRDGQILSGSHAPMIFAASDEMGILDIEKTVPKQEWSHYRIIKGQLRKQKTTPTVGKRARAAAIQKGLEAKSKFEALTSEDADLEDLRQAIRMLGERIFFKSRER